MGSEISLLFSHHGGSSFSSVSHHSSHGGYSGGNRHSNVGHSGGNYTRRDAQTRTGTTSLEARTASKATSSGAHEAALLVSSVAHTVAPVAQAASNTVHAAAAAIHATGMHHHASPPLIVPISVGSPQPSAMEPSAPATAIPVAQKIQRVGNMAQIIFASNQDAIDFTTLLKGVGIEKTAAQTIDRKPMVSLNQGEYNFVQKNQRFLLKFNAQSASQSVSPRSIHSSSVVAAAANTGRQSPIQQALTKTGSSASAAR